VRANRQALVVLVVGLLLSLVPLAHSSPPDPTWLPGVWDNGDYDDIVTLVTSSSGLVDAAVDSEIDCLPVVFARVRDLTTGPFAASPLLSDCPRAPPAA